MAFVEDMQLAEDRQRNVSAALAAQIYRQLHDPLQLIGGLNMNGIVLEDSYARMIGEINDYATKKKYNYEHISKDKARYERI